jgi:hypothetical protein
MGLEKRLAWEHLAGSGELAALSCVERVIFLDFRASITVYMVHWRGGA